MALDDPPKRPSEPPGADRPRTGSAVDVSPFDEVLHSAGHALGLAVRAVDITVVDVLEPWPPPPGPGLATGGDT